MSVSPCRAPAALGEAARRGAVARVGGVVREVSAKPLGPWNAAAAETSLPRIIRDLPAAVALVEHSVRAAIATRACDIKRAHWWCFTENGRVRTALPSHQTCGRVAPSPPTGSAQLCVTGLSLDAMPVRLTAQLRAAPTPVGRRNGLGTEVTGA